MMKSIILKRYKSNDVDGAVVCVDDGKREITSIPPNLTQQTQSSATTVDSSSNSSIKQRQQQSKSNLASSSTVSSNLGEVGGSSATSQKASTVMMQQQQPPLDEIDYDADNDDDDDDDDDEIGDDYELNEIVIDNNGGGTGQTTAFIKNINNKSATKRTQRNVKTSSSSTSTSTIANATAAAGNGTTKPSVDTTTSTKKQSSPTTHPVDSPTTSSSESGFGTVDDEPVVATATAVTDAAIVSTNSTCINRLDKPPTIPNAVVLDMTSNCGKQDKQQFPILQPPRKVIYELNTDDIVRVSNTASTTATNHHDHHHSESSMCSSSNSSSSDDGGVGDDGPHKNCLCRFLSKLVKFYYSCLFCYSPSSSPPSQDKPPLLCCCCTWLSIFCCCCPLLAGISLYLTKRSHRFKMKQKYELADKYSSWAEKLNIASLILGIIFYAIAFFMITLVIFMYWRPHNS